MSKILIIDDDASVCQLMSNILARKGYDVCYRATLEDGIDATRSENYDLVFLDVQLPDGNGLHVLPQIKSAPSLPEVIVLTGFANPDGAELSIKSNAWDYIQKPLDIDVITLAVDRVLQYREERQNGRPAVTLKREGIIGESPVLESCLDLVARASRSKTNILITGETGTGKELFARAIHKNSSRAEMNFVVVDCGALPESLIESLLFGHTKGAYTGADRDKQGFIKHADGGTLFLDEVGDLPVSTQKAFLRVLQERRFTPIGDTREIESNFRLIAATHRNLDELVAEKQFRDDLLFRLRSITIDLPPLRDRVGDIKDLTIHYVRMLCESQGIGLKGFAPEFFDVLNAYRWPGNVRELNSTLEYTFAQAIYEQTIFPKHLPDHVRIRVARTALTQQPDTGQPHPGNHQDGSNTTGKWQDFRKSLMSEGEQRYLKDLIKRTNGNIKMAARQSGLSQPRLYELLRKYGINKKN
jgi:two-component system NtrC family response regulator